MVIPKVKQVKNLFMGERVVVNLYKNYKNFNTFIDLYFSFRKKEFSYYEKNNYKDY